MQQRYTAEDFVVLSICADTDDPQVAADTAVQFVPQHTVWCEKTGLGLQRYSVSSLPTFLLIDRNQKLIARRSGAIDWSDAKLQELVSDLLQ